uniref:Uncharacterized protein n=1 Tax=Balaenoptera musculus TaxID=9771 RepID=A0A8C0CC82_BALMU
MSRLEISSSCFSQEIKFPPNAGNRRLKSKDIMKFTSEKFSVDEISQLVISPLCGTISLFVGTTRNNFEGKKVISLDVPFTWLPVSKASFIIVVSSAHRAASLEAVSYGINTLKAKVPIWKKEIYEELSSSWKRNKEYFGATSD